MSKTAKRATPRSTKPNSKREADTPLGESLGKLIMALWNSQKNPGRVYVGGYRIHHGAVGFIGALASAYMKKRVAYGFFKHLMEDNRHDAKEWFAGEKSDRL